MNSLGTSATFIFVSKKQIFTFALAKIFDLSKLKIVCLRIIDTFLIFHIFVSTQMQSPKVHEEFQSQLILLTTILKPFFKNFSGGQFINRIKLVLALSI